MVDMDKKEQILHYHRIDGLSQREIAHRVGVCRKTVKRYITEYEAQVQSDPKVKQGHFFRRFRIRVSFLSNFAITTRQVSRKGDDGLFEPLAPALNDFMHASMPQPSIAVTTAQGLSSSQRKEQRTRYALTQSHPDRCVDRESPTAPASCVSAEGAPLPLA